MQGKNTIIDRQTDRERDRKKERQNLLCLSWCDADNVMNYGQILQGCAMMNILRQLSSRRIVYCSYLPRGKQEIRWYYKCHYDLHSGHLPAYLKTKKMILRFVVKNRIHFSQVPNERILIKKTRNIGLMVCGSDQIWHPQNYNKNYFLNFGSKSIKRISFAVSLPKTHIEEQWEAKERLIAESLKWLDAISVREKGSVPFVGQLSGKNVVDVMDPTYLVDKNIWKRQLQKIRVPKEYIFVYIPNGMDENMLSVVNALKEHYAVSNVIVLMTRGDSLFSDDERLKYVSAGEFLYLIKNASCVFTSSFHAVVFSTIFHTEFFCYDVPNPVRGEDIRMTDILEKMDLSERLITAGTSFEKGNSNIDWNKVDAIIENEANNSMTFLKRQISEE